MNYRVHGLVLRSDLPLPELLPDDNGAEADIIFQCRVSHNGSSEPSQWFNHYHTAGGADWLSCGKSPDGYLLRFHTLADFTIDNDKRCVVCFPTTELPEQTIRHLMLNQVVPRLINLRGGHALHASAVVTPKGVAAFAGTTSAGKSTMAGTFLQAGCELLSDDCVRLVERDRRIWALPADSGLRLWNDSRTWLFRDDVAHVEIAHYTEKRRVNIEPLRREGMGPQPLDYVYLMAEPDTAETKVRIERVPPREALMTLIRCSFNFDITDRDMLVRQMQFLERLISVAQIRRVIYPRRFEILPSVREAILDDRHWNSD